MRKGFTLLELTIVIVIVSIFATLAVPAYNKSREVVYDNQAKADLKLMVMAEKNYYLDMGYYYPSAGNVTDINVINGALAIALPADSQRRWNYTVTSTGCTQATRFGGSTNWRMRVTEVDPASGTCP